MTFPEIYRSPQPVVSIELSPPRTTEDAVQLESRLSDWVALPCSLIHVAYGARPDGRRFALDLTARIKHEFGKEVSNHLTCVGSTAAQIDNVLREIREDGVDNIVALRGNPAKGQSNFQAPPGGYEHADQLVRHVKRFGGFGIAVGGHPEKHAESPSRTSDLAHLKRKVEAGADVIITQFFYDNRFFYDFLEECRDLDITVPIIPSLLPILDVEEAIRLAQTYRVRIPDTLLARLLDAPDEPDKVHGIGIEHAVNQASDLLDNGVAGIHFHVLNRYFPIAEILRQLTPALKTDIGKTAVLDRALNAR